jgi:hypothetical protein
VVARPIAAIGRAQRRAGRACPPARLRGVTQSSARPPRAP